MKPVLLIFFILSAASLFGQQKMENAENFLEGTVLVFQPCLSENVIVGKAGKKQTWNFSKLKLSTEAIVTETMILPGETNYGSTFPKANLVEKYSDGKLVFMDKTNNENYLVGFVDTASHIVMTYPDPMLFAKRPLNFGDNYSDDFAVEYTIQGMDFKSKGNVTIEADAFGTLILPNGKFENSLRVKIVQKQEITMTQYNTTSTSQTLTYVWFDKDHASALLKIDDTKSTYYNEKTVQYLVSETPAK